MKWELTRLELITDDNDKLNEVEQTIVDVCPALRRIPTSQKPVMIQGWLPKAHNPDFLLLDSIWVECKGHIRDIMYRPMLQHLPPWLKRRYHVMVCNNSKKERDLFLRFCEKHGVSASEGTTVPPWLIQRAIDLGRMQDDPSIHWLP